MKRIILIFLLSPLATDSMETDITVIPDNGDLTTLTEVYECLLQINCQKPQISLAQVILENGWILTDENNIIGMHRPRVRPSTNIATTGIKAQYKSKREALIDLVLWQLDSGVSRSTDYFTHLIRYRYNHKNSYVIELQKIMNMKEFRDITNKI